MKFSEAIKKKVGTDEEDEPAYYVLLEANGSEFFERVLWACIKAYDVVQGKETEDFSDFIDNVVDYDTFVTVGIMVFEKIVFSARLIYFYLMKHKLLMIKLEESILRIL